MGVQRMAGDESPAYHFKEVATGGSKVAGSGIWIDERLGVWAYARRVCFVIFYQPL
jgi:hypothetical protein